MAMASVRSSCKAPRVVGTTPDVIQSKRGIRKDGFTYFWTFLRITFGLRRRILERLQIERLASSPSPTGCPHGFRKLAAAFLIT